MFFLTSILERNSEEDTSAISSAHLAANSAFVNASLRVATYITEDHIYYPKIQWEISPPQSLDQKTSISPASFSSSFFRKKDLNYSLFFFFLKRKSVFCIELYFFKNET